MEVIGPTNCRCGAFVTTTIFLHNIFIVRLHLERGMIDIRNQVAVKPKFIMRYSVPHFRPKMNLREVIHCAKENERDSIHS